MINVADFVEPQSGKTYRQINNEKFHQIPLGSLVELMKYDGETYVEDPEGLRLNVVQHSRDCDGTPLYDLSHMTVEEFSESFNLMKRAVVEIDGFSVKGQFFAQRPDSGHSEESLKVIRIGPKKD